MSTTCKTAIAALVAIVVGATALAATAQQWEDSRAHDELEAVLAAAARAAQRTDHPPLPTESPAVRPALAPVQIPPLVKCPAVAVSLEGLPAGAIAGVMLPWHGSAGEYVYAAPTTAAADGNGNARVVGPAPDTKLELDPGRYRVAVGYIDAGLYRQVRGVYLTVRKDAEAPKCD